MIDYSKLIEDFSAKSHVLEERLEKISKLLSDEKAPSEEDSESLISAIDELRSTYSTVVSLALDIDSDVTTTGSVSEYARLFDEHRKEALRRQIEGTISILENFIAVSSESSDYSDALEPYKIEVKKTLAQLRSSETSVEDKASLDSGIQKTFLDAIEMNNLDSPDGESLMDILENAYSKKVNRGIYLGKYIVGGSLESDNGVENSVVADTMLEDSAVFGTIAEEFAVMGNSNKELSAEDIDDMRILRSLNSIKDNLKVNVNSFKKELYTLHSPLVRYMLPAISLYGVLDKNMMVTLFEALKADKDIHLSEGIDKAIELLKKRGVLSSFELGDSSIVYALTSYGRASLDKESVKKMKLPGSRNLFWKISIGNHDFTADNEADFDVLEEIYTENRALFSYIDFARNKLDSSMMLDIIVNIRRDEHGYVVPVQWGYEDYSCLIAGQSNSDSFGVADGVLIIDGKGEKPAPKIGDVGKAFLLNEGELFKWDGDWVESSSEVWRATTSAIKNTGPSVSDKTANNESEREADVESSAQFDAIVGKDADEAVAKGTNKDVSVDILEGANTSALEKVDTDVDESVDREVCRGDGSTENNPNDESDASPLQPGDSLTDVFCSLVENDERPSDDKFVSLTFELLNGGHDPVDSEDEFSNLAGAFALIKAASTIPDNIGSKKLYKQLALATNVGIEAADNSSTAISRAFPEYTESNKPLIFAAYCYSLFAPHRSYDFDLKNTVDIFLSRFDEIFPGLVEFKPLLSELSQIFDVSPEEGLSDSVLCMMGSQDKRAKHLKKMESEARGLLEPPAIKAKLHGMPELLAACFGKGSELQYCLEVIVEGKRSEADIVKSVLYEYAVQTDEGLRIDESAIDVKIDDEWRVAKEGKSTSRLKTIQHAARRKIVDSFVMRLKLMEKWLSYGESKVDDSALSKLKEIRKSLIQIVDEISNAGTFLTSDSGSIVLRWLLRSLRAKLNDEEDVTSLLFASMLKTGHISLDERLLPIIDSSFNSIRFYEPWRNVLRHLSSKFRDLHEVRSLVFVEGSDFFDNLGQLSKINSIIGDDHSDFQVTENSANDAENAANVRIEKFKDSLEIAYAYSQVNEVEKENLSHALDSFTGVINSTNDFGHWKGFIDALQRQVDCMAEPHYEGLRERLDFFKEALAHGECSSLLDEAERLLDNEKNFTVAEDYLNRYESGYTELTDEIAIKMHDPDLFAEFISDDVFKPLYDACNRSKGQSFTVFARDFVKKRYPVDWSERQKRSCEELIKSWPVEPGTNKTNSLVMLLRRMGLNTRGEAERVMRGKSKEQYRVTIKPEPQDKTDYLHPISAFGTQPKSPLHVLVLYGNHTAQEIIDIMAAANIIGTAVVLVNHPVKLQSRRQMAELFHTTKTRLTSFLLIDQVLALHLALHQETERLPLMLKCTLPFTYYQPFVRDGGPTADEMFCGREDELRTIVDPNGASVVYGGRQLGKTALLERAKSLCMKPGDGEYAVYASILNCSSEEEVATVLSESLAIAGLAVEKSNSFKDLCRQIDALIGKNESISRILLLIDESDRFLERISEDKYRSLQPLIDLKRSTKNSFKFVLAGLHNVSRAKNATSNNGIFGQLGEPLCIKPLTPNEALRLISRPLTYLGFQVDRYPHLETILTSTNYYPGILQFFGYTLVETMKKQYGDYYRAADGNPPYALHREQLGAIMNRTDLNNSIKEKFRWSLELDQRYFMIARCIALMYYEQEDDPVSDSIRYGFSADEIKEWADGLGIACLENETPQSYVELLDEMRDMGILVRPVEDIARYRFRRNSFINIIGSDEDRVLEDIEANN